MENRNTDSFYSAFEGIAEKKRDRSFLHPLYSILHSSLMSSKMNLELSEVIELPDPLHRRLREAREQVVQHICKQTFIVLF